jgi:5'-deoxynucleotidase YfbR-like HD superfamily hydrolase
MTQREQALELLSKIEYLYSGYSNEMRKMTQPFQLVRMQDQIPEYEYNPNDQIIRESLMEHVGSLPIIATAIFPYIDDESVDISQALLMLAVHDIGELITGDEMVFTKQADSRVKEQEAALTLLDSSYHEIYKDIETQESQTAKFAKSIDKISADIVDYLTPGDITVARFKRLIDIEPDQIMGLFLKHKRPYMLWNPFLTEFHILLCEKLEEKLSPYYL